MLHGLPHAASQVTSRQEALPDALFRLMQLRLGVANSAVQDLRDLSMTVSVKFVQLENSAISEGKSFQGPLQSNAIEGVLQPFVMATKLAPCRFCIARAIQRRLSGYLLSKMHQCCIHRNAMKPRGECGLSTKCRQLPKCLDECLLSEVVSVRGVIGHAETHCINAPPMKLEERGKRIAIAIDCPFYEGIFRLAHK